MMEVSKKIGVAGFLLVVLLGAGDATKVTEQATMHALATARAADSDAADEFAPDEQIDGEAPEGGAGEGEEGAPSGGAGASQVLDQFQADLAEKAAADRHSMMSSFMHNFARNMKMAVLSDSQGDMPEDERQRMMADLGGNGIPPPEASYRRGLGEEGEEPPRRPRRHRRHMLNGGGNPRAAAEEAPEQEHMLNGGGRRSEEEAQPEEEPRAPAEAPEEEEEAQPRVRSVPRQHGSMMLNHHRRAAARRSGGGAQSGDQVSAMKQRHAEFMRKLEGCADEECVKELYETQQQTHAGHGQGGGSAGAMMPRRRRARVQEEDQDQAGGGENSEAPPPLSLGPDSTGDSSNSYDEELRNEKMDVRLPPERRAQEEGAEDSGGAQPDEEEARPRRHRGAAHPTVRDELGRPMPLLFSGSSSDGGAAGSGGGAPEDTVDAKAEKSAAARMACLTSLLPGSALVVLAAFFIQ